MIPKRQTKRKFSQKMFIQTIFSDWKKILKLRLRQKIKTKKALRLRPEKTIRKSLPVMMR